MSLAKVERFNGRKSSVSHGVFHCHALLTLLVEAQPSLRIQFIPPVQVSFAACKR
jgi:hypothetical protein